MLGIILPRLTKTAFNGLEATVSSGIRSVFCYAPTPTVKSWKPEIQPGGYLLDDWVLNQLNDLTIAAPFGNGRVQIGLAFDGLMLPKDTVISLYDRARSAGVKVITTHYVRGHFSRLNSPGMSRTNRHRR